MRLYIKGEQDFSASSLLHPSSLRSFPCHPLSGFAEELHLAQIPRPMFRFPCFGALSDYFSFYASQKDFGPFLIIVPLSTLPNWSLEFEKWAPALNVSDLFCVCVDR